MRTASPALRTPTRPGACCTRACRTGAAAATVAGWRRALGCYRTRHCRRTRRTRRQRRPRRHLRRQCRLRRRRARLLRAHRRRPARLASRYVPPSHSQATPPASSQRSSRWAWRGSSVLGASSCMSAWQLHALPRAYCVSLRWMLWRWRRHRPWWRRASSSPTPSA
ncbi:hypothetical protein T492DRAFT_1035808 [Pavlovales sp. CCMP2436]|nr:hypothetical protein T492DRAFT_1035808 [Pavlovales sp. CCMP2436]